VLRCSHSDDNTRRDFPCDDSQIRFDYYSIRATRSESALPLNPTW
jgi:hypothetical protein